MFTIRKGFEGIDEKFEKRKGNNLPNTRGILLNCIEKDKDYLYNDNGISHSMLTCRKKTININDKFSVIVLLVIRC